MSVVVKFKKLREDAIIPKFASKGAACFDLHACLVVDYCYVDSLLPILIGTGLSCEIPEGYELLIRPRSGLSLKEGITVVNSPGTIDSDYRGEIGVILCKLSGFMFRIKNGDRIAQGAVRKVPEVEIVEVKELSETERGKGGFGSTGV